MEEAQQALVYLIESDQHDNNATGTGFIIHQSGHISYLLTCAHVVDDIGQGNLLIDGVKADIDVIGASDEIDLAVLKVHGVPRQTVLELFVTGNEGDAIKIIGIHDFGQYRSRKVIRGYLGLQSSLKKPKSSEKWINAWELKLVSDNYLQPGYSGSPVIHERSGRVIAVATHRQGKGDKGLAISIDAIKRLWQPKALPEWVRVIIQTQGKTIESTVSQGEHGSSEIEHIHLQINSLEDVWKSLANKIDGLERDKSLETRSEEISRLKHVISKARTQREDIEEQISSLEERLQKLQG